MKALVIGANGFLGRNLVKKCLSISWDVTCVYHQRKNYIPRTCERFSYNQIDKIKSAFDVIFLLGAYIPYQNFDCANTRLLDSNIELTLAVCKKFIDSNIVFSSTAAVYGGHEEVITESSSFNNPNLYAITKLAGEAILRFHPRYQIIRYTSLYGNGMTPSTILPTMIHDAKNKKLITVYGTGSRCQDYLHVDDAVGYLLSAAVNEKSGIYLGANGSSYSNAEVAEIVTSLVKDCSIRYLGEDRSPSFRYNNVVTTNMLQYKPHISLAEGIKRIVAYV